METKTVTEVTFGDELRELINMLDIDAPEEQITDMKNLFLFAMAKKYGNSGGAVINNETGERVVNRLHEPIPLKDILMTEAKKLFKLKPEMVTTGQDWKEYIKSKGINELSKEGIEAYRLFREGKLLKIKK
jgi:hypothetical protein